MGQFIEPFPPCDLCCQALHLDFICYVAHGLVATLKIGISWLVPCNFFQQLVPNAEPSIVIVAKGFCKTSKATITVAQGIEDVGDVFVKRSWNL
jgi:hypothetical protein